MRKRNIKRAILASIIGAVMASPTGMLHADEFGSNTRYYEDDAWYDVSEWFDGNDYNPTDEAIGRWDDERWSYEDELTDGDSDNDWNLFGDYGYTVNDQDWFYDYYDDGYSDWDRGYYSTYFDSDDDGLYDAQATYGDTDGDGTFDDFDYYTFNSTSEGQQESMRDARDRQKQMRSNQIELSGRVTETKTVNVRDRKHLVAFVQESNGQAVPFDLGPEESVEIAKGESIRAKGFLLKVGDRSVFIATEVDLNGRTATIDRNGKSFDGTVESTRRTNIRGQQHQFAKLKTDEGKNMLVDLGPANSFDQELDEGANVSVQGVPVKVNERILLVARQITLDGSEMKIDRRGTGSN